MIEQIILTIMIVWFLVGLTLTLIGALINGCTNYGTNISYIGLWLLGLWVCAVVISICIGLIILVWR